MNMNIKKGPQRWRKIEIKKTCLIGGRVNAYVIVKQDHNENWRKNKKIDVEKRIEMKSNAAEGYFFVNIPNEASSME